MFTQGNQREVRLQRNQCYLKQVLLWGTSTKIAIAHKKDSDCTHKTGGDNTSITMSNDGYVFCSCLVYKVLPHVAGVFLWAAILLHMRRSELQLLYR